MLLMNMITQLRYHLRIRLRFEIVSLRDKVTLDVFEVGDDAIVDDQEPVRNVRPLGMRVHRRRSTVGSPPSVRYPDVGFVNAVQAERFLQLNNEVLQCPYFSRLLDDVGLDVAVDDYAGRVIAAVLEPLETLDKQFQDLTTGTRSEEVDVSKNAAHFGDGENPTPSERYNRPPSRSMQREESKKKKRKSG